MPHFVVTKIQNALNDHGKAVKGAKVHICGVSYKRDIDDVRESPALDIIHLLRRRGAEVTFSDPHVELIRVDHETLYAHSEDAIKSADCVVIVTDHSAFDYAAMVKNSRLIVDTRNALKGFKSDNIVRL
jgi:UDP-N-acetyl-D-glucosamine dehydrogenase